MEVTLKGLPEEAKELLDLIDQLPSMVGAPAFDRDDEWLIVDIAKFIVDGYRKMSVNDVRHAFVLAAQRKLYDEARRVVEASTYGAKMNINVVGKVLSAYQESLRLERSRPKGSSMFPQGSTKRIEEPKKEKISPEDAYDLLVDMCRKEKKMPDFFMLYSSVFKYLKSIDAFKDWGKEKKDELTKVASNVVAKTSVNVGRWAIGKDDRKAEQDKALKEVVVKKYFEENILNNGN